MRCGAQDGHRQQRRIGKVEDGRNTGHQVHAGRNHGGRVDQGRDRSRAFHGIGQPYKKRQLRGLTDGADKEQQGNCRDGPCANGCTFEKTRSSAVKKVSVPTALNTTNMASSNPTSPMRLTINAFLAAVAALFRSNQKPTNK